MRNKVWLLALALLVVHSGRAWGDENHFRSTAITQQAKTKVVKGVVLDDMGPVIGATVFVKGTQNGMATNLDGEFSLTVPVGATIVVSFIGYEDKEVVYKGEPELKIMLTENVTTLEEVQVIAYGTTKKVTVTGALSSMKSDEIMKSPVGSIANALSGKIPGLSSVQSSGQPGADDATIYVRGVGSLTEGLSAPLMLVDGVERSFYQLDPNEIEDITVLKDASATAVFGVRGANGVVLVTTKRGQEGKAKISFSTSMALQLPTRIPEFANSYDYATTYNNAQLRDGVTEENLAFSPEMLEAFRTHSNPLIYSDTDWTDMLIRKTAVQTQHNFNISGGSKRVRYFASLGVFTQDGLFKTFDTHGHKTGFKYNRYNYRVNMDVNVTKTTSMKINLGGRLTDKREPNYNNGTATNVKSLFRDIYWTPPFAGPGIVDGKWVTVNAQTFGKFGTVYDALNSYYGKGFNTYDNNVVNFDFVLDQKLDFLTKGLKAHVKGAYNSGVSITKRREGRADRYEAFLGEGDEVLLKKNQEMQTLGYSDEKYGQSRDWYLEAAVNYQRKFGPHNVSALFMYNQNMKYYYSDKSFPGIPRSYVGLVGRATYDYKTRYLADFSIGYNGSENFAEGSRFGFFPSFAVGYMISNEEFFKPLNGIFTSLKLRASYGLVGNSDIGSGRFPYLTKVNLNGGGSYQFGKNWDNSASGTSISTYGADNVTWEIGEKYDIGVDMTLFKDLNFTIDYFRENRKNIFLQRQTISVETGITGTAPYGNLGRVKNEGLDMSFNYNHSFNKDFFISARGTFTLAKNEYVERDEPPYEYSYMSQVGQPLNNYYGYIAEVCFRVKMK